MTAAHAWMASSRHQIAIVVFGKQHTSDIDLAAADVRVDIDPARHHCTSADVNGFIYGKDIYWGFGNSITLDVYVLSFPIDTVARIIHLSAAKSG